MSLLLHAISYHNIGPFREQTKTVCFKHGNYLISAPIGSGKSFLFFDGPAYALYKHSHRMMLNKRSTTGWIDLRFQIYGQHYRIRRTLKKTAAKEGCSTQLRQSSRNGDYTPLLATRPILSDQPLDQLTAQLQRQPIALKNETDLQQHLNDLLPPKEVFLSTYFLMQDSTNIFEATPAERLDVFKNIFGLLDMDHATDLLADKKREVTTTIKALSHTDHIDHKLRQTMTQRMQYSSVFLSYEPIRALHSERSLIQDKVTMEQFRLDPEPHRQLQHIGEELTIREHAAIALTQRHQSAQQAVSQHESTLRTHQQQQTELHSQIAQLQQRIQAIDTSRLQSLKTQKTSLMTQVTSLLDSSQRQSFTTILADSFVYLSRDVSTRSSLSEFVTALQQLIAHGKLLKEKLAATHLSLDQLQQQIALRTQQSQQQHDHQRTMLQTQLQTLQTQQQQAQQDLLVRESKVADQIKTVESQLQFHCDKIDQFCPYIQLINTKTVKELQRQSDETTAQYQQRRDTYAAADYDTRIRELSQNLLVLESQPFVVAIDDIQLTKDQTIAAQQQLQQQIDRIATVFTTIPRKQLQETHTQETQLYTTIRTLDQQIIQEEQMLNQLEDLRTQLSTLQGRRESGQHQLASYDQQGQELRAQYDQIDTQYRQLDLPTLHQHLQSYRDSLRLWDTLDTMIQDYRTQHERLRLLRQEEQIVTDLYQIFSRELLYVVLRDSLPILTSIINSYLERVVSYRIDMKIIQNQSDAIQLQTLIIDDLGDRDVSSLSGGQRVVLKLVWMLAVSSFTKARMLFLDETINNMDHDTIADVASLLADFIKQHDLVFYTITHSEQIKQMALWDEIVDLMG